MAEAPPKGADDIVDSELRGTTYRVYRYMLKRGKPLGISEIQKGLGLSSPSVSQYHIKKLLRLGLIREEEAGYVVDKVVIENIIRIRRVSIPVQAAYVAFFAATLVVLVALLRPAVMTSLYFFALVVNCAALGASLFEAVKTLRRL
jgi:predicted DNA-binding transcriptional regulator